MSYYRVEWDAAAIRQLEQLDNHMAAGILVASDDLAESPTTHSRLARPPFLEVGQDYDCWVDGRSVVLTFQYGQDEQTLHILNVSVT